MIYHGGGLDRAIEQYGGEREDWLDLSTGINPNPYPVPHIPENAWANLPDSAAHARLEEAACNYYQVTQPNKLVAANGTQALIEILPRVINPKQVAILEPTYGEHFHCWNKAGVKAAQIEEVSELPINADCLVVVNPNNPDAKVYEINELTKLAHEMKLRGGWLIVDEAFCDCFPQHSLASAGLVNVIILRSFGKFFGLAGMRLGFAISNSKIRKRFLEKLGPWAVSGPALEVGAIALTDTAWIDATRLTLQENANAQAALLRNYGIEVLGSNPLFIYAKYEHAKSLYQHLCENYILVRPFQVSHENLRFGICGNERDVARLEKALKNFSARAS